MSNDNNIFQKLNDSSNIINNDQESSNIVNDEESIIENENIGPKLAPFNPTSTEAIKIALDLLELKDNDILYDLGCGDGRLLIEVIIITLYKFLIFFFNLFNHRHVVVLKH